VTAAPLDLQPAALTLTLPRAPHPTAVSALRHGLGAPAWRRLVVPALGLVCLLVPALGSVGALLLGVAVAFAGLNVWEAETSRLAKRLLTLSVMGLGAGLDLHAVAGVGLLGAGLAVGSIAFCLSLGWALGRLFRVDAITGLLVAAGTAICGGSAIAAVAPTLRAREHQVTAALGTVFALNALALLVFPAVGHALGMDAEAFGLWCAIAIHDTSSVVGAAMTFGPDALEVATTVKLARALWIVPLTAAFALHTRRQQRAERAACLAQRAAGEQFDASAALSEPPPPRAARPWFILGFVALAALSTLAPSLAPVGDAISALARRALVLTLFLVGAALSRESLRQVGVRPFAQGALLWAVVSAASLGVILLVA
jgi:uncharacterized membrane protein YadS